MANYVKDVTEGRRPASTWVKLGPGFSLQQVETWLEFRAIWRGEPVVFTVLGKRYTHTGGLSPWSWYISGDTVHTYYTEDGRSSARALSDAARRGLAEAVGELVEAELEALDISGAVCRTIKELDKTYRPADDIDRALVVWGDTLPAAMAEALRDYAEALRGAERSRAVVEAVLEAAKQ